MSLKPGAVLRGVGIGLKATTGEVRVLPPATTGAAKGRSELSQREEVALLGAATSAVSRELTDLAQSADAETSEVIRALKVLLEDDELISQSMRFIESGWAAATAFGMAVESFRELLGGSQELEDRYRDLEDLARRVQSQIRGPGDSADNNQDLTLEADGKFVLVARELSALDIAQLPESVVGVVAERTGATSHAAIICRAKGIPAIFACGGADKLEDGDKVLVDPVADRLVLTEDVSLATLPITYIATANEPIINVMANIGSLVDARTAAANRANGVGLFRTELLYLSALKQPDFEEQVESLREVFEAAPGGPIVVRTIDVADDKQVPFLMCGEFEASAVGFGEVDDVQSAGKGYFVLRHNREFLRSQLFAIERARQDTGRDVWVMAPQVVSATEVSEFVDLARSSGAFRVGIMVEDPSMAHALTNVTGQIDFLSVGTNDLTRRLFATQGYGDLHPELANHWQPELIAIVAKIAQIANNHRISVGVCGESAADPAFAIVLAGLGIDSVSVSPSQLGLVRDALSSVDRKLAIEVAREVLRQNSAESAKLLVLEAIGGQSGV